MSTINRGYIIKKQGDNYALFSTVETNFGDVAKNFIVGPVKLKRLLEILENLEK